METLIFQLHAPLSSWGEVAVGEYRPTAEYPGDSAIHGLLAAALGIDRDDDDAQTKLRASYRMVVGVISQGRLLRDFHTAQVPSRSDLKKRPHATRRDELAVARQDLNTILSSRDYRQDAASLVALQAIGNAPYCLQQLADALIQPKFVLYLGRKSCPLATPLHPCILNVDTIQLALTSYQKQLSALWQERLPKQVPQLPPEIRKLAWGDDFGTDTLAVIGVQSDLTVVRKDRVITRRGWQFSDRREHIALLVKE